VSKKQNRAQEPAKPFTMKLDKDSEIHQVVDGRGHHVCSVYTHKKQYRGPKERLVNFNKTFRKVSCEAKPPKDQSKGWWVIDRAPEIIKRELDRIAPPAPAEDVSEKDLG